MTDGKVIFDDAAALAFPRYPGSEGDARAISWLERRFQELGLESTLQWFTYDLKPAQRALRVVLVASAVLGAAAGVVTPRSPVIGLAVLVAAFLPGAVFLAWSPWLEKLYRREGGTRTANVIGRLRVAKPRMTMILMAHHDSKSQSLSFPFRMGLTITTIAGACLLATLALIAILTDELSGSPWLAPAAMQMGSHAGRVIATGNRESFRYRDRGMLATIGRARAVGTLGRLRLTGLMAWLLWSGVHVFYLIDFRQRTLVMLDWIWSYWFFSGGARLITHPTPGRRQASSDESGPSTSK